MFAGSLKRATGGSVPNLGMGELIVILVIVLLIFGASRLPQIGEGLGKAIRGLKRGLNTDDDIDVTPRQKQVPDKSSAKSVEDVSDAEIVEKKS
jgi:sec-independent protein translocase protein TatA